ncbi:PREDICTED: uncharacterized protein LOC108504079 isoform X1 [Lepidothrix coronata]|uniref:Uncharacterized protein LOC108504079 isoform X1 n=1 Tax=Lepidothrix coronata TaxID=321398 RepID=A0A6J0IC25_9PASS|nr:PREDICTED: uncharacterized protein LOC108504079 isoform X1 [Lepidothrix coronata]
MFWVRPCKLLSHRELPARLSLDGLASPLKLSAPGSLRESLFQQTGPIRSTRLLLERGLEKRDGGEGVSPTPPGPRVPPARRFPANTGARTLPQPLEDQRFVTWRRKPGASNTEIISWIVPDVTEEAGKPQAGGHTPTQRTRSHMQICFLAVKQGIALAPAVLWIQVQTPHVPLLSPRKRTGCQEGNRPTTVERENRVQGLELQTCQPSTSLLVLGLV